MRTVHDTSARMCTSMAHKETIETYDRSARKLAEYFAGIGARIDDIERALQLANATNDAKVVEAGCGDGRDAAEIAPRVAFYEGFDPSKGLLAIAHERLPSAVFIEADAHSYTYPSDLDVVYAFASFLHIPRESMPEALHRAETALKPGGILYLSLKERAAYEEEAKKDEHGERMFYYYTPQLIAELAGKGFESVYEDHQTIGSTQWFTVALRKK